MTYQIFNYVALPLDEHSTLPDHDATTAEKASSVAEDEILTTSPATSSPNQPAEQPVNGLWFVASCLLLPVVWGVLVHLLFNRLRRKQRPDKLTDTGWPDYQI